MPERGIVVSTPFDFDGEDLQLKGGFDAADLRQWVLYWDKIDWPTNNLIHLSSGGPEIDFLEQEGVLVRSDIRIAGGGNIGWGMVIAQGEAFRRHQEEAPGADHFHRESHIVFRFDQRGYMP